MQISKTRMKELDMIVKMMQSKSGDIVHIEDDKAKMLHKYEVCHSMLLHYGAAHRVAKMMMNDTRFEGVTLSRCHQIIQETMYIYGTGSSVVADYYFNVLLEKTFELMPKMIACNDWKAFNGAVANIHKILEHFKASEAVNKDLLQQHDFTLVVNVDNKSFKLPLSKMMELSEQERISLLDSLRSDVLGDDMVEFIEHAEGK
jgi:hypothetical protein